MIVDGNGENFFGMVLPNHMRIQQGAKFGGSYEGYRPERFGSCPLLECGTFAGFAGSGCRIIFRTLALKEVFAGMNAAIADAHAFRSGNQFAYRCGRLAAEGADSRRVGHRLSFFRAGRDHDIH